jgi:hypothetical protein
MNITDQSYRKVDDVIRSIESIELAAWRLKQWEEAVKSNNVKNLESVNERSSKQAEALHSAPIRD